MTPDSEDQDVDLLEQWMALSDQLATQSEEIRTSLIEIIEQRRTISDAALRDQAVRRTEEILVEALTVLRGEQE